MDDDLRNLNILANEKLEEMNKAVHETKNKMTVPIDVEIDVDMDIIVKGKEVNIQVAFFRERIGLTLQDSGIFQPYDDLTPFLKAIVYKHLSLLVKEYIKDLQEFISATTNG